MKIKKVEFAIGSKTTKYQVGHSISGVLISAIRYDNIFKITGEADYICCYSAAEQRLCCIRVDTPHSIEFYANESGKELSLFDDMMQNVSFINDKESYAYAKADDIEKYLDGRGL